MVEGQNAGRPYAGIESDRLLLVEGRDEVNLFGALLQCCFGRDAKVQIMDVGGERQFAGRLKTIVDEIQARPSFRSIGVVRDADDNPGGAFRSVCGHVRGVGYEPPTVHGRFSDGTPSIGVFIVPDGKECGAIETLCRRSMEGSKAAECVEEYLQCLDEHNAMKSTNRDKSFAHAYLAAGKNPVARVGEGAKQGVWNFQSPAFAELSNFLRELVLQGT